MRSFVLTLLVLWPAVSTAQIATLLPVSVTCAQSAGQQEQQQTLHDRRELLARWIELAGALRDRVEALQRLVDSRIDQYSSGAGDFQAVYQSLSQLRAAQYEWARVFGTEMQRQHALQESWQLSEKAFRLADQRSKAGQVSQADVFQAKALMAEARIAILRDRLTGGDRFPRIPADLYPEVRDPRLPEVPSDAPSDQEALRKGKDPPDER